MTPELELQRAINMSKYVLKQPGKIAEDGAIGTQTTGAITKLGINPFQSVPRLLTDVMNLASQYRYGMDSTAPIRSFFEHSRDEFLRGGVR